MSPKIRPWTRVRPNILTEQGSSVSLETFNGADYQAACGKLILMALSGQLTEASAQKHAGLHWPSAAGACLHQVSWHFIIWHHGACQPFLWCHARGWGWNMEKQRGKTWVCIYFPGHLPRSNCVSKEALIVSKGRKQYGCQFCSSSSLSWYPLLPLARRSSYLPVPSIYFHMRNGRWVTNMIF